MHDEIPAAGGFVALASIDDLPDVFVRSFPHRALDVDIVEPLFSAQRIAEGGKDISLVVGRCETSLVKSVPLCRAPLCAAVRETLLDLDGACGMTGLKGLRWLGLSEGFPFDVALEDVSRERCLDLDMAYEWHDYRLILDQIRQGSGACIVPASCAHRFRQEGIAVIPLKDKRLTWGIHAILPRDRVLSRGIKTAL